MQEGPRSRRIWVPRPTSSHCFKGRPLRRRGDRRAPRAGFADAADGGLDTGAAPDGGGGDAGAVQADRHGLRRIHVAVDAGEMLHAVERCGTGDDLQVADGARLGSAYVCTRSTSCSCCWLRAKLRADAARPHAILGAEMGIGERAGGVRPLLGGDPGRQAVGDVDRCRERGVEWRLVGRDHRCEVERAGALPGQRRAERGGADEICSRSPRRRHPSRRGCRRRETCGGPHGPCRSPAPRVDAPRGRAAMTGAGRPRRRRARTTGAAPGSRRSPCPCGAPGKPAPAGRASESRPGAAVPARVRRGRSFR